MTTNNGNKTFFARLKQGQFIWWAPVCFKAHKPVEIIADKVQPANELRFSVKNNTSKDITGKVIVNPGQNSFNTNVHIKAGTQTAQIMILPNHLVAGSNLVIIEWNRNLNTEQTIINWNIKNDASSIFEKVNLSTYFNDVVTSIFKNKYLSPRPVSPTLQLPTQGIGNWCYPMTEADIDDSGLRKWAGEKNEIRLLQNIPFATPGASGVKNILFTSLWDNYPDSASVSLTGKASHVYC